MVTDRWRALRQGLRTGSGQRGRERMESDMVLTGTERIELEEAKKETEDLVAPDLRQLRQRFPGQDRE